MRNHEWQVNEVCRTPYPCRHSLADGRSCRKRIVLMPLGWNLHSVQYLYRTGIRLWLADCRNSLWLTAVDDAQQNQPLIDIWFYSKDCLTTGPQKSTIGKAAFSAAEPLNPVVGQWIKVGGWADNLFTGHKSISWTRNRGCWEMVWSLKNISLTSRFLAG